MSGLAGVVRFTGTGSDDEEVAATLGAALAHRGPDGEGRYRSADGSALLVHRRLAIVDPSSRAAQPMASVDGRFHLAYDGKAYNYRDLRERLRARGAVLRGESDAEAVLHLLAHEGPPGLAEVRGMFALALWDARERTLLLARDRFGIKPLYMAARPDSVAFASEIDALHQAGLAGHEVSPAGVLAFLAWGSVPQPLTWLAGVEALEPGTWRIWRSDGTTTSGHFADAAAVYATDGPSLDQATLRRRTSEAIADSVRAHLIGDVPVGVLLSGGTDSAAIVSAARAAGSGDLHTYTVSMDGRSGREGGLADATAAQLGSMHHDLRVDGSEIAIDLDAIIATLDQPTAGAVASYYVSRAVAATGVKAVLSGLGGDVLFGGYPSFRRIPPALSLGRALGPFMRLTGVAGRAMPRWRAATWRHFVAAPRKKTAYRALRGLFMPEELSVLAGPALGEPDVWNQALSALAAAERWIFDPAGEETDAASVARMEMRALLSSQLRAIDVMSMAYGLEVRTPFVDHVLQRALWPSLGAHPGLMRGERLLQSAVRVPSSVVSREKRGLMLPLAAWLRGPLRTAARDGVDGLVRQQWIDEQAALRVWSDWERGQEHPWRVWSLAMLGRFLERTS